MDEYVLLTVWFKFLKSHFLKEDSNNSSYGILKMGMKVICPKDTDNLFIVFANTSMVKLEYS